MQEQTGIAGEKVGFLKNQDYIIFTSLNFEKRFIFSNAYDIIS